jgi:hypothetical protein
LSFAALSFELSILSPNCHACNGCAPPSPSHRLTESPSQSSLPADFGPEERFELLLNFLNPDLDTFRIADLADLRLSEFYAYIKSHEFQELLAQQIELAEMRAKACAKMAQPKAVAALDNILTSYTDLESNQLPAVGPITLGIRQRHRESARRAAWLVLKISGAIPPALAARAKALRETLPERDTAESSSIPSAAAYRSHRSYRPYEAATAHQQHSDAPDGELPTDEPTFLTRHRAALDRRAHELARTPPAPGPDAPASRSNLNSSPSNLKSEISNLKSEISASPQPTTQPSPRSSPLDSLQPAGP